MTKQLILLILLTTLSFGQSIEAFAVKYHYETDYNVAVKKAKEAHKPIFFIMVTNYCPWCRKYEKRTLSDANINTLIHKRYIPLILNREKGAFPAQFKTPIIPVTYIYNPVNDVIVKKEMGYKGKQDLLEILK